jgi:dipeptidyl aminopeptidase/acylaminoacyl peptidase
LECVLETEAEFGRPQWVFGLRTYGFDARGRIVAASCRRGEWSLSRIDPATGLATPLPLPYNEIDALAVAGNRALLAAGSPVSPPAVVSLDLESGSCEVLREAFSAGLDAGFISEPEPIAFPTTDGHTAHALYYPPRNPGLQGPDDDLPPLIVTAHGGPTSSASATLNPRIQYWTSRGIAVLDVDYRGSTGYGRAYRDLLKGKWGVYDVDDCVRGARLLVVVGRVDGRRIAIRGGSAGGFTTLASLAFRDFFRAGASYYGVGDLEALARDTHKFESRYLDSLIGPYPQRRDLYIERSPVRSAGRLSAPVIFFQGLEDRIVPPDQAESMVAALRTRGIPVAYLAFEGEQHGFRKAETIRRTLEAELYFYSRVFGFTPADELEPVEIENL